MWHRTLLATLIRFALFPASAWAQGYGSSLPPPPPTATAAGWHAAGSSGDLPPQAPLPVSPAPSGVNPAFAQAPAYAPRAAISRGAAVLRSPPPYAAAPPPAYATAPSIDGTTVFPTTAMPTLGSRWMFSAEAIWLQRIDNSGVILGNTVTDYGSGLGYVTDILTSTDVDFPLDFGVRLQAGYRFTDQNSRDAHLFRFAAIVGRADHLWRSGRQHRLGVFPLDANRRHHRRLRQ